MSNKTPNLKRVKGDSYYGKVASNYQKRRERQHWWPVEQRELANLLKEMPDGQKVLDVPFGTGRFVPAFLDHGYDIYGLDASDAMLDQARNELGEDAFSKCKLQRGFSTDLPYGDKEFDLLVSCRFLRDIIPFGDAKKSLSEFSRVTKSYAIIQLGAEINGSDDYPQDDERMGSRLTVKENEDLLAQYNFEIIDKRDVNRDEKENSLISFYFCKVAG